MRTALKTETMNSAVDLRERCDRAVDLMVNSKLLLHENVNAVLEVFNKLYLDASQAKNNQVIMRHFGKVNGILKKYDIMTADDYRKMSIDDLYTILLIIRKMIDKLDLPEKK
jgi:hypothetical protein